MLNRYILNMNLEPPLIDAVVLRLMFNLSGGKVIPVGRQYVDSLSTCLQ